MMTKLEAICRFIEWITGECPASRFTDVPLPADGRFSFDDCEENCDKYTGRDNNCWECWHDWIVLGYPIEFYSKVVEYGD